MTTPKRPKQHWLPANVLGQFSTDIDRPHLRERRLYVVGRDKPKAEIRTARNLAYIRGLYDWKEEGPAELPIDTLDETFNAYEKLLPDAVSTVDASQGWMPLESWLRALVPYIAGLTIRSPHFLAGARDELGDSLLLQSSRWMEMTRALSPIMAADWYLMRTTPDVPRFIINDRGCGRTYGNKDGGERHGLLVPLAPHLCLIVLPTAERFIGVEDADHGWITSLQAHLGTAEDVAGINAAIAHDAVGWVAGAAPADVDGASFGEIDLDTTTLGYSWPDRGRLGAHDQDWTVAMQLAGFGLGSDDWQPLGIFSGIEPGVRLYDVDGRRALEVSFLKPQDPGLVSPPP